MMSIDDVIAGNERYCRKCDYALFGLASDRCPECGRDFDLDDSKTYHVLPRKRRRRRLLIRTLVVAGSIVIAMIVIEKGLDYGHEYLSCSQCGARCRVNHLSLYGIGGQYDWKIDTGATAKFIQKRMSAPCTHYWELYDGYWGSYWSRAAGTGNGFSRYWMTNMLDNFTTGDNLELFESRAAIDAEFEKRFIRAVRSPQADDDAELITELLLD